MHGGSSSCWLLVACAGGVWRRSRELGTTETGGEPRGWLMVAAAMVVVATKQRRPGLGVGRCGRHRP